MKRTKFVQMLKAERNRNGHSQFQTAEFLCMSQPAYSRMEKGRTNPGVARSLEIIKILEAYGYTGIQPIELEEIDGVPSISFRWPWHKYWLYAFIIVVAMMAMDYLVNAPGDIARGFSDGLKDEPAPDDPSGLIFLALAGGVAISGLYRGFRRWRG